MRRRVAFWFRVSHAVAGYVIVCYCLGFLMRRRVSCGFRVSHAAAGYVLV